MTTRASKRLTRRTEWKYGVNENQPYPLEFFCVISECDMHDSRSDPKLVLLSNNWLGVTANDDE